MADCVRGCVLHKRHLNTCPVENYQTVAWTPADLEPEQRDQLFDGDAHLQHVTERSRYEVNRYGGLDERRLCPGCQPREATNGLVCEQCHIRLAQWLGPKNGLSWAYYWLGQNLAPGQTSAARQDWQRGSSSAASAALAIDVHDLRQEIAEEVARYLARLCTTFNLHGPDWFHGRVAAAQHRGYGDAGEEGWQSWLPQNSVEVSSACRYLATWLDRVAGDADLVTALYEACGQVMRRTATVAPWRGKAKALHGIPCPECEHDALMIDDGDEHVTCRRCNGVITRKRYDIWSEMFLYERAHTTKAAS